MPRDETRQSSRQPNDDNPDRDEDGRFTSGSRSTREDDDSRTSRAASGQGRGWHGDPEGHAEAGRHSHDYGRVTTRSSSRYDDDDDDYRTAGRGRDDQGRFTSDSRDADDDHREFSDWHAYGHARGWHAHQQGRHGQANQYASGSQANSRGNRNRDDEGRFTSGSRNRDNDYDNRGRSAATQDRDENGRFTGNRH